MPRLRIILLDQDLSADPLGYTYHVVLWADVPATRQSRYANSNAGSAWIGATAADIAAIQSGAVAEQVTPIRIPIGSSSGQIQAFLQSQWNSYQSYITNYNPWIRYGSNWDGTNWNMVSGG